MGVSCATASAIWVCSTLTVTTGRCQALESARLPRDQAPSAAVRAQTPACAKSTCSGTWMLGLWGRYSMPPDAEVRGSGPCQVTESVPHHSPFQGTSRACWELPDIVHVCYTKRRRPGLINVSVW